MNGIRLMGFAAVVLSALLAGCAEGGGLLDTSTSINVGGYGDHDRGDERHDNGRHEGERRRRDHRDEEDSDRHDNDRRDEDRRHNHRDDD